MANHYTPSPGSSAALAVAHLATLPPGATISGAELADAIGQRPGDLAACMAAPLKHGLIVAEHDAQDKRKRRWRLATDLELNLAALKLQQAQHQKAIEQHEERAEDRGQVVAAAATPGPMGLGWKPAQSLYAPPPEPDSAPASAVEKQEAPREQHLATRAWFSSDGQLVVETPELELVFPRLEARQVVRAICELGEAWA
jgi:DNA-binding MarR family transcriptional regulator